MLDPEPNTFDAFSVDIRAAFKHPAYESGMAAQLDNRKQGIDESPVLYCYEKLNLCRKVDPNMAEGVKLQHLLRGYVLRASFSASLFFLVPILNCNIIFG